jgi:predicted NUDIX family phosphoesterase
MDIEEIVKLRDKQKVGSRKWTTYNDLKVQTLEEKKPSMSEKVFYCYSYDLNLPEGYIPSNTLPKANLYLGKRSELEYNNGVTKQIIPYVIIKYEDEYYFALREGGGEDRLLGKIGLLGGHVGREGISQGMLRELHEEAGIRETDIKTYKIIGLVNSNKTKVNKDHLGIVYKATLRRKNLIDEAGILKGMWVKKSGVKDLSRLMEDWLQILVKHDLF